MKENTFTPLLPDQIEAVANWINNASNFNTRDKFIAAFSAPPEPEYIPGRWCHFKKDEELQGIVRVGGFREAIAIDCEIYFNDGCPSAHNWIDRTLITGPATPEQIQHHLSLAAEKKGFKPGVKFISAHDGRYEGRVGRISPLIKDRENYFEWRPMHNDLATERGIIYVDRPTGGSWAEIVQEEKVEKKPVSEVIEILNEAHRKELQAMQNKHLEEIKAIQDCVYGKSSRPQEEKTSTDNFIVVDTTSGSETHPIKYNHEQWEYVKVNVPDPMYDEVMADMGSQGWEAWAYLTTSAHDAVNNFLNIPFSCKIVHFKRRKK